MPFVPSRDPADRERSLLCLTQAIYYETRNQSADGQRAVAQVVLNRVRHPAYPNSVCGVVFQGAERRTGCQFSFTCDGSMRGAIDHRASDRAERIADDALNGSVYRPVGLALNYHTTAIVGAHIFYRRPDTTLASFSQLPAERSGAAGWTGPRDAAGARWTARMARQGPRLGYADMLSIELPVSGRQVRIRVAGAAPSLQADGGPRCGPAAVAQVPLGAEVNRALVPSP